MYKAATNFIVIVLTGLILLGASYFWLPEGVLSLRNDSTNLVSLQGSISAPKEVDFTELVSRPIFQKSRRFSANQDENKQEYQQLIPDIPVVKGLAITEPNDRFVFIQSSKDGMVYQLREGQLLDRIWRVVEINFSEILLMNENGDELVLDVNT